MNKIAVFDIDGTVYREAMSFVVAEELLKRHKFTQEQALLDAARHIFKSRGSTEAYWAYNKTILEVLEAILPRITPVQLQEAINDLLTSTGDYCYAYTTELIRQFKQEGRTLIAISGSIGNIVEPFSTSRGFDLVVASDLELIDSAFIGKRATQTKQGKDVILKQLVAEHGLSFDDSIAVGDTHRDISMMAVTERPIAFNPNAALFEEAQKRNWQVVVERKNMIYEMAVRDRNDYYDVQRAWPIFNDHHQEGLR
jgi:HAD superfamily hydrolase (TIGR01490 family)